MKRLLEVIVPLPLNATFTYAVPELLQNENIAVGSRVIVPFGQKKFYTAIVVGFPVKAPDNVEPKEIVQVLDTKPVLCHPQLKFWNWMADYYLCSIGDVMKAALPAALKIESTTTVTASPEFEIDDAMSLNENDKNLLAEIKIAGTTTLDQLQKKLAISNITSAVDRLITIGAASVAEKLVERYHARTVNFVKLVVSQTDAFKMANKQQRQESLILSYLELSRPETLGAPPRRVSKEALLNRSESTTDSTLMTMVKKGIFSIEKTKINRFDFIDSPSEILPKLSDAQANALDEIHKSWYNHDVTLLHGVTSSGKTEIYIHLIDYVLRQGSRAFFLVPEIALTTQLTSRLQDVFGKKVLIYHSKFTDSERVDIWNRLLANQDPCVVIGARSAVFLPFRQLGLVIVDEEHEPAYKQVDPAPRYNARDAAIVLASLHGAKTLLGSATPSIESYFKALNGKFGLVSLTERFGNSVLPEITITDLTTARRNNEMRGPMALSTIRKINKAISEKHQAIMFQNRRGFAPIARCTACAWIPKCDFCDVSMTVHRSTGQLVCHYCGATRTIPTICPQCGEARIEIFGYGTERIESSVNEIFDNARVLRMDLDTTRNKDGHQRIINEFSEGKADILVGTQMVTKGLDFDNVSVVAVMNADAQINLPDFRASERAFNMLEQVAGRAGRRGDVKGEVVIQTYQPNHPMLSYVKQHDYKAFYDSEIEERKRYFYPPFTRIVNIYIKNRDYKSVNFAAKLLADRLRELLGNRVNGPDEPPVSRVQSLYIRRIMLKVEVNASMVKVKTLLLDTVNSLILMSNDVKRSIIYYDVDPI